MRIELQIYLKEKRSNTTMDSLKYLEGEYANSQKYPNLSKILRRYYCPLPGSAASERLLSTARYFLRSTRLRLKPKNFESLLLKYNLRTLNGKKGTPPADYTPTVADCHQMSLTRASRIRRTTINLTLTSLMMKIKLKQRFMMIDRSIDNILFMLYLRVYTYY